MKLNLLVAKPYLKKDVIEFLREVAPDVKVLLDSGAFTDWKKGKETSIDEFMKFLTDLQFIPWRYFTLDVIGNEKRTLENLDILYTNGFKPVPIFTRGADPKIINKFYELSDLIGIGGLVGTQGNKGFVKGIMNHIGDKKVHWLGFGNNDYLAHYKPFSVDSSSWSSGVRYGTLQLYFGNGRWKNFKRDDFNKKPSQEVINLFRQYEEDPLQLRFQQEWTNIGNFEKKLLPRLGMKAWAKYQIEIEQKLGVKFFLSCGSLSDFVLFHRYHLFWKSKMNDKIILRKQDSSNIVRLDKGLDL